MQTDCSVDANEEIIQSSGCTTEPVVDNQDAESIPPVSISVQCTLISLGPAFTVSRFMDDPKAMLYFFGFEDYDRFSQFSGAMTANLVQAHILLSLKDQLFLTLAKSRQSLDHHSLA